jgi:hypothetical protein
MFNQIKLIIQRFLNSFKKILKIPKKILKIPILKRNLEKIGVYNILSRLIF